MKTTSSFLKPYDNLVFIFRFDDAIHLSPWFTWLLLVFPVPSWLRLGPLDSFLGLPWVLSSSPWSYCLFLNVSWSSWTFVSPLVILGPPWSCWALAQFLALPKSSWLHFGLVFQSPPRGFLSLRSSKEDSTLMA